MTVTENVNPVVTERTTTDISSDKTDTHTTSAGDPSASDIHDAFGSDVTAYEIMTIRQNKNQATGVASLPISLKSPATVGVNTIFFLPFLPPGYTIAYKVLIVFDEIQFFIMT